MCFTTQSAVYACSSFIVILNHNSVIAYILIPSVMCFHTSIHTDYWISCLKYHHGSITRFYGIRWYRRILALARQSAANPRPPSRTNTATTCCLALPLHVEESRQIYEPPVRRCEKRLVSPCRRRTPKRRPILILQPAVHGMKQRRNLFDTLLYWCQVTSILVLQYSIQVLVDNSNTRDLWPKN